MTAGAVSLVFTLKNKKMQLIAAREQQLRFFLWKRGQSCEHKQHVCLQKGGQHFCVCGRREPLQHNASKHEKTNKKYWLNAEKSNVFCHFELTAEVLYHSSYHDRMNSTYSGTRQHGVDQLWDHGQVDGHPVSFLYTFKIKHMLIDIYRIQF